MDDYPVSQACSSAFNFSGLLIGLFAHPQMSAALYYQDKIFPLLEREKGGESIVFRLLDVCDVQIPRERRKSQTPSNNAFWETTKL
jgi:hypothetical protein